MAQDSGVMDEPDCHRFVHGVDGTEAQLVYRRNGRRLILVHTEVPDELSGRGVGGLLVKAAVDDARAKDSTLVPRCPFARSWLERHPDQVDGVDIDWRDSPA